MTTNRSTLGLLVVLAAFLGLSVVHRALGSDPIRYQDGTIVSTTTQLTINPAIILSSARSQPDGTFQFALDASAGRSYPISVSSNLVDWSLLTIVSLTNSHILVADPQAAQHRWRFYRVGPPTIAPGISNMVIIPPGSFTMGSPSNEPDRFSDEGPQTQVTISKGFWLGKYEVTQREYQAVMGSNPSSFKTDLDLPVEQASWSAATNYCAKLTEQERAAGRLPAGYVYRLPTEAEWEYACRAGTTTATAFGDQLSSTQANFDGTSPYNGAARGPSIGETAKVGSYAPNAWGLHDMHGNVLEWCADWYGTYPGGSVTDPTGPSSGSFRVFRGGSWFYYGLYCRSANRFGPPYQYNYLGFRVALVQVP